MDEQLHSPARRLIELRIAHAELDGRIDALAVPVTDQASDDLTLRRLKKQRLALRDEIARLERASDPDEPA
ncbi:YdcH family protein [Roseateles chitosanitabidus]|jgi:hypothetical protein|uniref:YdcH family protein n=1 Tax=Roseateles chitosanitabidus TaxID=65048 RepID=UPI00082B02B6|nr:YdcH family protein [Roseateles chitosanitabidus]MBO9688050.1 YdcH family protein [Roseateles chitosanitabidus]